MARVLWTKNESATTLRAAAVRVLLLLLLLERWGNVQQDVAGGGGPFAMAVVHGSSSRITAAASEFQDLMQSRLPSAVRGVHRRQLHSSSWAASWWGNEFNVLAFGAKGDGRTPDTQAFEDAWAMACTVPGAILLVPKGQVFVVGPITFLGPCEPNIAFQVDGKLLAVGSSASGWGVTNNKYWLQFKGLIGLTIRGQGWIDGNGATWWTKGCRKALKVLRSKNVVVSGITIQNAAKDHLRVDTSSRVLVTGVSVKSPADSRNTDGFSFVNTHKATLKYSSAATGGDCVSILSGSLDILVEHFTCGPGHGISIGSLGHKGTTGCVSNVRVHDVTVENADGALRIKTWQGGSGSVTGISFENITVKDVKNPIVIDQYYCDSSRHSGCKNSSLSLSTMAKALAISDVSFRNVKGTYLSSSGKAVYIACSDTVPCTGISMINVNLWPASGAQIRNSESFKGGSVGWNAFGSVDGFSSTVGLRKCVTPQPITRFWGSTLASCKRLCSQS